MTDQLANQPSAAPTPKLVAGTISGAATTVLLWAIDATGVDMPLPVAGAVIVLAGAVAGYFKRNRAPRHAA